MKKYIIALFPVFGILLLNSVLFSQDLKNSSPELEKYYFEQWNYPYGAEIPVDKLNQIWEQIRSLQSEPVSDNMPVNSWRLIGPYGSVHVNSSARFSGRILDIEAGNTINPVVATASGGLWSYFGFIPYSLSDDINSLVCGSFATNPSNANIILLGTGEPGVRSGTGLYRSTNSGGSWVKINLPSEPSGFFKIRFANNSAAIVHAATSSGYFRSTNGGLNWVSLLSGSITDIAVNPSNSSIVYAGKWGDGVYKSTNGGLNWAKVTTTGMPTSNVGRVALTIGTSNSNKVYTSIARDDNSHTLGVYVSTNEGASWANVTPPEDYMGNQGWYDNIIGVCPANSNIVITGGVTLWKSTNSGSSWTEISDPDIHADQHAIEWDSEGNTVYIGNDGGLARSTDQGVSFSTGINYFPITQYVNFDIGVSNRGVIYGGSQDNGITGTTDGGLTWNFTMGGDGGGVAIDPISSLYIYCTRGVLSGNWSFKRYRSTDKGFTWSAVDNGVDPSDQWYTKMRSDRTNPVRLYTNSGPYVYSSTDQGSNWVKLNNSPFPAEIYSIDVSKNTGGGAVVYASLNSSTTGQRLRVYDGGSFFERSSGLPLNVKVRGVATHISNSNTAYAIMNGYSAGQKVYKTTNRGVNWTNISGNLPDVTMGDLVPHPSNSNYLYVGTQMGCYKTTNNGVNWMRWNNGMPEASIVTEMKWIDSTIENGRFYVAAATYGRSIYVRDVSGDDPIGIVKISGEIPGKFKLEQNYPNPFNPVTNIKFSLPKNEFVKIEVFDLNGKVISVPLNRQMSAGEYNLDFDASHLSSGVYFYRIKAGNFSQSKKMLLIK